MSIANKLNSMIDGLQNSYNKLEKKKATIPENKNFENLADTINSIPKYVRQFKTLDEMAATTGKEGELAVVYGNAIANFAEPAAVSVSNNKINYKPKWFSVHDEIYFKDLDALDSSSSFRYIYGIPSEWESCDGDLYSFANHFSYLEVRVYYWSIAIFYENKNTDTRGEIYYSAYDDFPGKKYYESSGVSRESRYRIDTDVKYDLPKGFELVAVLRPPDTRSVDLSDSVAQYALPYLPYIITTDKGSGIEDMDLVGFYQYTNGEWVLAPDQLDAEGKHSYNKKLYGINGVEDGTLGVNSSLSKKDIIFKANIYSQFENGIQADNIEDVSYFFEDYDFYSESDCPAINFENARPIRAIATYLGTHGDMAYAPKIYLNNVTDMRSLFEYSYLENIEIYINSPYFNTGNAINMYCMFYSCHNLTSVPYFDTSNVRSTAYMFNSCYNLTSVPYFDTSNVRSMSGMFYHCYNLTNVPNFDTSNVTSMYMMFSSCRNLTSVPYFDTSNVRDMSLMLCGCNNLTTNVPNFNTSNVTNMYCMFYSCYNLTSVPYFDTSNVRNMSLMLGYCNNLTTNVPNFNTSKVTSMESMFSGCYNLTNVPNFDTSNVTHMEGMFQDCFKLINIPNFNTSNVTNMGYMFYDCHNLTSVPYFDTSSVRSTVYMFYNCYNLTTVPNFNTSNVTDMGYMFFDCYNLTTVPNFNTSNVTDMGYMFFDCHNLTTAPNFDTSNVTNMSGMFYYCSNLTEMPIFNTSNVTNMCGMFYYCSNLTEMPIFNTSNVIDMDDMFESCRNLTNVPNFDTSNVTSMRSMFYRCNNLTTVPNFDTSNVTHMEGMFESCGNLVNLGRLENLGAKNVSSLTLNLMSCINLSVESVKNIAESIATLSTVNKYNIYLPMEVLERTPSTYIKMIISKNWGLPGYVPPTGYTYTLANSTESISYEYEDETTLTSPQFVSDIQNLNGLKTIEVMYLNKATNVTNISGLFANCSNLQSASITNCSLITNISNMFAGCNSLTNISLNSLGTAFENVNTTIEDRTLDLSATILDDAAAASLFSSLGKAAADAKIILGDNNFNAISDGTKTIAAKKKWTIEGFTYEPVGLDKLLVLGNANLASTVKGGKYAFTEEIDDEGKMYLKSSNAGIGNSKSEMSITITQDVLNAFGSSLTFNCYYSSESIYYDYGEVYLNNNQISNFGGRNGENWQLKTVTVNISLGDVIYITYRKDGSVDSGYDAIKVYLAE